jgi:DNA-binding NtrC family response regulator
MARILILGLEASLADQLGRILLNQDHQVETGDHWNDDAAGTADVIFSGSDDGGFRILTDARRERPGLPVVVVSRFPETTQWIDALEAGAIDYCAAPFEHRHIRWILETALHRAA